MLRECSNSTAEPARQPKARMACRGSWRYQATSAGAARSIRRAGLPIANLTTNGLRLTPEIIRLLVSGGCDQVVIRLNATDEENYSRMMGMPRNTSGTVLENVCGLVNARRHFSRKPRILVHFPVWKENFRTLPAMYAWAGSRPA